jgi:uncharacterized protein YprB with RNaseH-like and TPR domain
MDLDDKLKLLKKEREARRRGRLVPVEKAWARIDRDADGLTVKEKLEKLINLTSSRPGRRRAVSPFEPEPRKPIQVFENAFPLQARYGKLAVTDALRIPGEILWTLSRDPAFRELDLSSALIIDLETTGLAGGTGTVAFLVGMGFFRDGRFVVAQHFLGDLSEEERLIADLGRFFGEMGFRSVITYNGKAFDVPLLETRFILYRQKYPLADLPHLDFLFAARSLWKDKHESCRLFHLAQQVVEASRDEDIPSAEIPYRYFDYLRNGNFSLIEPILYHNQEDILSLLGLVISAAELVREGGRPALDERIDALDLIGVGRIFERAGDTVRSVEIFRRALEGRLPVEVARTIKHKLSAHFKRNARWDEAVSLWQDLLATDPLLCYRELSKYYEHKAKDFGEAQRYAEEGLALAVSADVSSEKDFERRIERLAGKSRRWAKKAGKAR